MGRKPRAKSENADKTVAFNIPPQKTGEGLPFDDPRPEDTAAKNSPVVSKQPAEETAPAAQASQQTDSAAILELQTKIKKMTATNEDAMNQTAQLSSTVQQLQKAQRDIVPSINQLITALELAQQKGAFSLKQAAEVFAAIQTVSSLLQSS